MAATLASYQEPLFWLFPVGSLVASMVAFALFAAPLTWIAWAEPAWARPYRLQSRPPREQQLVADSVRSWLVNNAYLAGATIASWPLLRLTGVHAGPLPPWWVIGAQLVFVGSPGTELEFAL